MSPSPRTFSRLSPLLCCALLFACGRKPEPSAPPVAAPPQSPALGLREQPRALAPIADPQAEAAEKDRQAHAAAEAARKAAAEAAAKAKAEAEAKAGALALHAWKGQAQAAAQEEYARDCKTANEELPAALRAAGELRDKLARERADEMNAKDARTKAWGDAINACHAERAALDKTSDAKEKARLADVLAAKETAATETLKAQEDAHETWMLAWEMRNRTAWSIPRTQEEQAARDAHQAKLKAIEQTRKDRFKDIAAVKDVATGEVRMKATAEARATAKTKAQALQTWKRKAQVEAADNGVQAIAAACAQYTQVGKQFHKDQAAFNAAWEEKNQAHIKQERASYDAEDARCKELQAALKKAPSAAERARLNRLISATHDSYYKARQDQGPARRLAQANKATEEQALDAKYTADARAAYAVRQDKLKTIEETYNARLKQIDAAVEVE